MGQPKVASVTWRDRIRRISQGFYETMGQQIPQTRRSKPMRAWSHVKILNRDLRSTVIFLRKPKGIGQTFRLRGRHWIQNALGYIRGSLSNQETTQPILPALQDGASTAVGRGAVTFINRRVPFWN